MFAFGVWLAGLALEAVLLFRAARAGFVRKYVTFYLYLSCVFFQSFSLLIIYFVEPRYYKPFYWYAEFLSVVFGYGVILGIYRQALCRYPGAARMARNMLLFILTMVSSKVLFDTWSGTLWWPSGTVVTLERDFRAVQAVLLIGLLVVIAIYRIPLGQNLWGMIFGYGLFISTSVMILALRVLFGRGFQAEWRYLQPLSYLIVLCIWCITLWSYKAVPVPNTESGIERDYQRVAAVTREGLHHARASLGRAIRP